MTKQQFIIDTLKPYFLDKDLCAFENGSCKYLTSDSRMCAVGKHLDPNHVNYYKIIDDNFDVIDLQEWYGINSILNEESKNILSSREWLKVQSIHDYLAENNLSISDIERLEELSETNLTELKQLL